MQTKHVCMLPKQPVSMHLPPTASCFRWALDWVRRMTMACEWHYGTVFHIRSRKNLAMERERQRSGSWLVCHPYSPIQCYWNCIALTLNILAFFYIPLQVFLVSPNPYDAFILFCDSIALLDICLKFITGYNDEDNKLVILNKRASAKRYLRGYFFFDVIGALPLQIYQPHPNHNFPTHTVMFIFKLARLPSLSEKLLEMIQQLRFSYVTSVGTSVVVKTLLFFHWMTYIHYQVPAFFSVYYNRDVVWKKQFNMKMPNKDIFQVYTKSLYWVCGLCVGEGYRSPLHDYIIPDLLLTSSVGIIGLLFIIYSFTTLLRLFIYGQYDKYLYNGRLKDIENYMKLKRLPEYLKRKVHLFLNYKFHGTYFNEEAIMNTLNVQIKQDINMHFCKRLVTNIPIFQDMSVTIVNTIIFSLIQVIYMPGEKSCRKLIKIDIPGGATVVSCGDPVDCLYIIYSGTVSVMNSAGKEITHLRDGAYFGEDALFNPEQLYKTTIITLEITVLYKLPEASFRKCVRPHFNEKPRASAGKYNESS